MDVWLLEYAGELYSEDATTDEVTACRWTTVAEIKKLYEDNLPVIEQNVYLFGTDEPLKNFQGKVISVWHRFDDVKDK